jgi:AcrR family transcriptional regulator
MSTKEKILKEALSQFNERGLHQVGIREIARTLGISPGNMSYHFPKKEDLLVELLKSYSGKNQAFRNEYQEQKPTLDGFLNLFRNLFLNQYEHRGIFAELVEVNRILSAQTDFNYSEGQEARIREFESIVSELQNSGKLINGEVNRKHLVSFLTLFGRFWISEAFLSNIPVGKDDIIDHYLNIFKQQLCLQATTTGKKELDCVA